MDDAPLTIPASTGKRIAALVAVVSLLVNVGGWASTQMVNLSQMRTEIAAIRDGGSTALKAHTSDAMAKFVDQERRIVRLETKIEEIGTQLHGIQSDVKEVLKELRSR